MFVLIYHITYCRLLDGEFTMVWRVVSLMWWMALIELLAMCGGLQTKKNCGFLSSIDEAVPIFGATIEVSNMVERGVWKYDL